jgi:two-component system cell cycle sensor histidine kinase/response regulator CckA
MSESTQNPSKPLRILLLEDSPKDAALILNTLTRAGLDVVGELAANPEQFRKSLVAASYDLVLCDFRLQAWDGLAALRWVRQSGFEMPFIYVSGTLGEELAVQSIKEGATDYVLKNSLERLPHAVRRSLAEEKLRQEHQRIEDELRESERQYQLLFDRNPQPMWVFDRHTLAFLAVNQAAIRHYGYSREEFLSMSIGDIRLRQGAQVLPPAREKHRPAGSADASVSHHRLRDGRIIDVEVTQHEVAFQGRDAVLVLAVDVTERKRHEERLRQSEERFSKAFRSSPLPITIVTEKEDLYLDTNEAFLRMTGWTREEVIGHRGDDLHLWAVPEHRQELMDQLGQFGRVLALETKFWTRAGEVRTVEIAAEPIQLKETRCVLTIMNDVTEARLMEQQFRQAQKMEAVGRLAGGIAHDFNNLIMVVESYAHLAKQRAQDPERVRRYTELMEAALERATALTRQLLAFGRKHAQELQACELNSIVGSFSGLLDHVVPEDIQVSIKLNATGRVLADPGQIEQVLMNFALNARDAMPNGGLLSIETSDVELTEAYARSRGAPIPAGSYQMIAVADNGTGMDEATQAQIFEPFFTTKPAGKGTGLGLATAYAIMQQHGGHIWVYSEPGRGTNMKLYFPQAFGMSTPLQPEVLPPMAEEGNETLLLVEDQIRLREVMSEYLSSKGYNVISAADGPAAMDICRSSRKRIDVLITDLIIPGACGSEVARVARQRFPALKVIYMSGYSGRRLDDQPGEDSVFLEKPFDLPTLTRAIRQMVNRRSAA